MTRSNPALSQHATPSQRSQHAKRAAAAAQRESRRLAQVARAAQAAQAAQETSTPAPLPLATAPSQEAGDPTADDGALHANGLAFTDDYDDAQLPPDPPHPDEVLETQLPLPGISQPAGVSASQPAGVSTSQPVGTLPSGTLPRCPFNWHACELFAAKSAHEIFCPTCSRCPSFWPGRAAVSPSPLPSGRGGRRGRRSRDAASWCAAAALTP